MNYEPIVAGTQSNGFAGTKASDNAGQARKETELVKDYILLPLLTADPPLSYDPKSSHDDGSKPSSDDETKVDEDPRKETECKDQEKEDNVNNTNNINTAGNVNTVSLTVNVVGTNEDNELPFDPNMPALEDVSIFNLLSDDEDDGTVADINNLDTTIQVSPILTIRIHKDHHLDQVIEELQLATQIRKMKNPKRAIGTKWVFKNKKDKKGIVIRNKVRLVAQGYTQEEEIDYDEVFAPVARIKAIRLFLAYASFKNFTVYQMDVKNAFLYGKIEDELYVCQLPGFEDLDFLDRVYKVEKALYRLHHAPRAWYETLSTYLLDNEFQRGKIDNTLFIKRHKVNQKKDGIFNSQEKYVAEILKKFRFTEVKTASTPMETQKPLLTDKDGEEVDVHIYMPMIGSLMYLTSSRPDIMFAVCACARYQVNLKVSHLHAVKRIFRYLKGQPKLGLWYLKDSPFDLIAYTDSDYAGASLDRKSTTGGCQFLRCRLISWKCKKHTVVANFTTKAEYVAASSCCRQVLWNQNQLLDYRDCNKKQLIQMVKIHTDKNVAYLLTKAFDFWSIAMAKTINGEVQLHAQVDGKEIVITESSVRRDLQLVDEESIDRLPNSTIFEQLALMGLGKGFSGKVTPLFQRIVMQNQSELGEDEAVYKELGDSLVRATTIASSLGAKKDSGNITKTQSKATPNESSSQRKNSGGGPRCQETIGDTTAQTRFESVSKHSNDSLLAKGNTLQSDEDSMKLNELMALCTTLQNRVLDLDKTKTT
nr:retrotransposon protein, putative, Ty1-copia subclass [Tanacetum cinerariifolium]